MTADLLIKGCVFIHYCQFFYKLAKVTAGPTKGRAQKNAGGFPTSIGIVWPSSFTIGGQGDFPPETHQSKYPHINTLGVERHRGMYFDTPRSKHPQPNLSAVVAMHLCLSILISCFRGENFCLPPIVTNKGQIVPIVVGKPPHSSGLGLGSAKWLHWALVSTRFIIIYIRQYFDVRSMCDNSRPKKAPKSGPFKTTLFHSVDC